MNANCRREPLAGSISFPARLIRLVVALGLTVAAGANGASFTVTNNDFVGGVYDFHYYTFPNTAPVSQAKRTVINGRDLGISDPTLTNNGWEFGDGATPNIGFWAAPGAGGPTTRTSGELTMGWDFSAVSGRIVKIEVKTRHILFQFDPFADLALGDQIAGFVATPNSFGTGSFNQIYSFVGDGNGAVGAIGQETILDITSFVPAAWLADPRLLEFKFIYAQTPNPTIPGRHLQIFRDNTGTGNDAFLFRVTLASCVTTAQAPGAVPSGVPYSVSWNAVASSSYEIQEATAPDFSNAASRTVTGVSEQFVHTVTTATTYFYRVRPVACEGSTPTFGPVTQTVVLPQQEPRSSEFDLIVPFGSTMRVTQEIRFESQPPGATFSVATDQPFLSVTPQSGVVPSNGVVSITVTGDPTGLQVGANTGTVILTVTTPDAGRFVVDATSTVSKPVSISLVTPVAQTPKGVPPGDALLIPAVAHLEGAGTRFQSDIRLSNANATEKTYLLSFTPQNIDGTTSGRTTTLTVQPEQTVALNDVLRDFFSFAQPSDSVGGSLEVRSTTGSMGRTFLTSRTYATTSIGTFGQFVPAIPLAKLLKLGAGSLTLTQVSQGAAFRSNIGLVEGLGIATNGRLRVFNVAGQNVRDVPFSLRPFEFQQLNALLATIGAPMNDARIELVVDSGAGGVSTYASVIDNRTQDPLLASPIATSTLAANRYVLPGMADLESPSTNFHSDVRIFNPAASAVSATMTYYPQGNPSAATVREVMLLPGEIKTYDDVLPALFGLRATGGAIVVTTPGQTSLVVSGRTYTIAPGGGTFGQFIPAVIPADGIGMGDPPLQILQLEQSPNFRSNVGLNELTGNPVTVRVALILADTRVIPSTTFDLQANEFRQLNSIIANLTPGKNAYNARVQVTVLSGTGRVTAYASVIDNRSLDPTFVPAQK